MDPEFWWKKTSCEVHDGGKIIELSPERYLLYLFFRAFAKGFFPLKYLVLAAGLIVSAGEELDWREFFLLAEECGMGRLSTFTLAFMEER